MGSMVAGGQDCGGGRGDADRVYPARGADRPAAPARRTVRDVIPVCGRTSDGNTMRYGGGSHAAGACEAPPEGREHALKPSQPLIAGAAAVATLASIAPAATTMKAVVQATRQGAAGLMAIMAVVGTGCILVRRRID